jgi:hypothetical protein
MSDSHGPFVAFCAALAAVGVAVAMVASLPLLSNADDAMIYYSGGYVAAARLGLAPRTVADPITILDVSSDVERGRRKTMLSAYALVWIPQAALLDAVRRAAAPGISLGTWIVCSATVIGLCWVTAMFFVLRRSCPQHSLAWLLIVLLVTVFIHQHTRPPDPVPRNLSTFACGMAAGIALMRRKADSRVWALLALAACLHIFQQALTLSVIAGVVLLMQPARLRDTVLPGFLCVAAAFGLAMLASSVPLQQPSAILASSGGGGVAANWAKNSVAVIQVCRYMAPLVAVLVWSLSDIRRGLLAGMAVVVTVAAAGLLTDPGPYLGEYPNRLGGAWNCAIFALLLQRDWLTAIAALRAPSRQWAMAAAVVLLVVMVARMDARYILRQRLHSFRARLATIGFSYPPGVTEGAGLSLIPRYGE